MKTHQQQQATITSSNKKKKPPSPAAIRRRSHHHQQQATITKPHSKPTRLIPSCNIENKLINVINHCRSNHVVSFESPRCDISMEKDQANSTTGNLYSSREDNVTMLSPLYMEN
ncbi:hypothetical protein Pcinc_039557 [Petrolisthes cinctipes]|uniref:Uncharacterized protein n=1 Tax=Petrolisthes cinctipes TaxID=88211 RepID=A0AAE1BNC7_PETCI|nr:hypothetical protein Pcinc_039557 [Petrolisthes cinctipes]